MEASCSGLQQASAQAGPHLHQSPRFVILCAAPQHSSSRRRKAALGALRGPATRRDGRQQLSHGTSQRPSAVRAQEAEVLSTGEVADVEAIEGIRVLLDEQKKPMVEYLIKWKVIVPLFQSHTLSRPCQHCPWDAHALCRLADMHVCCPAGRIPAHLVGATVLSLSSSGQPCMQDCVDDRVRPCLAGSLRGIWLTTCYGTLRRSGGKPAERYVPPSS